jgi:hypothetical protein
MMYIDMEVPGQLGLLLSRSSAERVELNINLNLFNLCRMSA